MPRHEKDKLLQEIDVLKRRVAELERRDESLDSWERKLFRVLVESAPEHAICIVDESGKVMSWNVGAKRLIGYAEEEILGQDFSRFYTPDDIAAGKPARDLETARTSGRLEEDEIWRVRKDGSRFLANALMLPLRDDVDGRFLGFVRVVRDVTERKLAEKALRESEHRFRLFMDNSPTVKFIMDDQGRFIYVNATWQRTFHSVVGEWAGRTISEVFPPEVAERLRDWERTELPAPSPLETLVTRPGSGQLLGLSVYHPTPPVESLVMLPTRQGEAQWGFLRFAFIDFSGRRLVGGIGSDVTEREKAYSEIARLNDDLEHRVRERTAQLTVANEELNAFCYSVSHDLRAPLRAIIGFSQAVVEDYGPSLDATACDYLSRVQAEAHRMSQLIDDLLALSRVSRSEIRREPVDVSSLVGEIAQRLGRRDPGRKINFEIAQNLTAHADRGLLRIALENLLENAWKFTSKQHQSLIQFGVETHSNQRPAWYVRDDGVGFDMQHADHLFGAFQRLHSDAEYPGTGIGLATVQRVIHRHGGRVWAQSTPGQGATFYFTLEPDLETPQTRARASARNKNPLKDSSSE